ncbi:MAG: autotransporter domain-containing protein [Achromobacter pulmonis]
MKKKSSQHYLGLASRLRSRPRGTATHLAILTLCQLTAGNAQAQPYVNYDGTRTHDLKAAVATWADNPEFKADWGLAAMNAQYAYARGFSGAGIKLGSVDSGYQPTHQEFAGRHFTSIRVNGQYLNDGSQLDGNGLAWHAGDAFDRDGIYINRSDSAKLISANDNHGNHVSGTIAAARNGKGMMGVAFNSIYYTSNTNGTDGSIYGSNMDYNYFKAAYGNLAAAGVRAINSSWGSPPSADDYDSISGFSRAYLRINGAGKKTWLDAAADVARGYGVLHVWANGNAGAANSSIRAGVPYFRPDIERFWIAVTGLDQRGGQNFNRCGVAKYWCVAAPGVDIDSVSDKGNDQYVRYSGTSMAAPHVTGALGVLMERYPYLGNEEIRTILLTTASHRGAGPADVPNATYGWGVPDLKKGMEGPSQFLGRFNANLPAGVSDTWSNSISEAALLQRKQEEKSEIAGWTAEAAMLARRIQPVPDAATPTEEMRQGMARARALLQRVITSNLEPNFTYSEYRAAVRAAKADPYGAQLLSMYDAAHPGWAAGYSLPTDYDAFLAGRTDEELAHAAINAPRTNVIATNASTRSEIDLRQRRVSGLAAKPDSSYQGSLVKTGMGTLILTGNNSYSGGTQLREGTLGLGHDNALGTGLLAISNGATLLAAADGLNVRNTLTLAGLANVDTAGHTLTLSGSIRDDAIRGGLVKAGAGTLVLAGAGAYSGPTLLQAGVLRAGVANGFSSRSAFLLNAGTQLDLADLDQTVGSLAGRGDVALGKATLTTGADNRHTLFAGRISGQGGLTKIGAGTLELSADNKAYTGKVTLAGGGLWLGQGARLGGRVLAQSGTLLGGEGSLGGATIAAGAVHAPGNPLRTQQINGDYVNHGTLRISGAPSAVSRINAAGAVDIAGGTLELRLSPEDAASWQPLNGPYTLIAKQSAGAVAGTFASIRNPLLFLNAPVSTSGGDGNDVTLSLERNDRSMASLAATRNQAAVASAIDALPQTHEVWRNIALSNDAAALAPALTQLSGDTHASVATALANIAMTPASLNGVVALRQNLSMRMLPGAPMAALDNGEPPPAAALPRRDAAPLWVRLGGQSRRLAGDGSAPGVSEQSTDLTLGGDVAVGAGWRLGGAWGYTDARLGTSSRQASATLHSYTATVYGGKDYALGAGTLTLTAGGAYAWHHVDSRRAVRYGSLDQTLTAGYRGATTQVFAEAGYALALSDTAVLEPFVNLAWNQLRMQGFSESGGSAALASDGQRQRNLSSLTGVRGGWQVPGTAIALRGMLGWRHVYGNTRPSVALSFSQGPTFDTGGAPIARDAARIELGADIVAIRNMTAGLNYGGEFGGGNRQHAGSLEMRWRF